MHKITKQIIKAFLEFRALAIGNSHTYGNSLYLHGGVWDGEPTVIERATK